jgi:HemK-like putative methylase
MTPRATSEHLVHAALELIRDGRTRIVDAGTGSGALAIAIASTARDAVLWATDTSLDAVALARANVRRHALTDRITVCLGDLLEPVPGPVDLAVANLPYLPAGDSANFPNLASEPGDAVFAVGDGLDPYRRLIDVCARRLSAHGAMAIQLHRRVLTARSEELPRLLGEVERVQHSATRPSARRQLAAAA